MTAGKFNFLDSSSTSGTSNTCKVDSTVSALTIQVYGSGTISLKVQGLADTSSNNWVDLAAVKLNDLSVQTTITSNGIYQLGVDGLSLVRVVSTETAGSVKVFGIFSC